MPALAKVPFLVAEVRRGSRGQQPRGAAVSAAMDASCAGDVLRAAVVAREPVSMRFRRRGGRRALAKMPPLTRPTKISGAMPRAKKNFRRIASNELREAG